MKITDYQFNIGDEVVTIYGETGKITYICECHRCKKRGFCEPIWKEDGSDEEHYIDHYHAEQGFLNFYRIGKYRFGEFVKDTIQKKITEYENELDRLKKLLKTFEEIETRDATLGGDNNVD